MQDQLTHYRILEQIGAGGMGVVYRAHDDRLDRDVALKVLPSATVLDDAARKRLRKEAQALSKLNHPNIATVFDFDTQDGTDFLVEELIEGLSLDATLRSGPLSEREIVNLGSQLADGVAAAHERGILHRDLKPANVRVTPDARLKILDFGLATMLRGEASPQAMTESLSDTRAVAGTLPYMAPEQLLGGKLDARTDIWAVGCVLYEMVTANRPFPGSGPALTDAILHQSVASPVKLNARTSPGLESIILKCLEKDPALRYQSAREIAVDLHRLAGSSSAPAPAIPAVERRWRTPRVLVGGVAVVLLGAAAVGVWSWSRTKTLPAGPQSIAVLPFADMSPGKDQEYFSDGLADELISDLAKIPDLRVTARTSSFQFKGKSDDLRSIGRQLNVRSILEGSVRKDADRLRITVQLINAQDGFHVWSETYERRTSDIFAVQEEIARAIANALRVTLLPGRVYSPKPTSPEAYSAYLQGRYAQSTEDWQRASGYYQQAVRLDPNFAPAWAWLGAVHFSVANSAAIPGMPQQPGFQKSREAAQQALKLDPESADAHRVLGMIKLYWDWDWSGADAELRRALELEPNNVYTLQLGVRVSLLFGRCADALEFARRGVELNPMRAGGYYTLASALRECGSLDDTVSALKKALELAPNVRFYHYRLGNVYFHQGKFPDALAQMEQETDPMWRLLGLTLVYHKMGNRQESDAALQGLVEKEQGLQAFQIAEAYACRGEPDNALRWLQTAYDRHDSGLSFIKTTWCFRNIQNDARYQQFLRKMNLPQ